MWAYLCNDTKVTNYRKNVRGTICGSQVVENPETVRPNPAQTMYEVQPSRLLPIQISTFDCQEQAMTNIRAYCLLNIRNKGIDFFGFQPICRSQLGRLRAIEGPAGIFSLVADIHSQHRQLHKTT